MTEADKPPVAPLGQSQLLQLASALSSSLIGRGLAPDQRAALACFREACSVRCASLQCTAPLCVPSPPVLAISDAR